MNNKTIRFVGTFAVAALALTIACAHTSVSTAVTAVLPTTENSPIPPVHATNTLIPRPTYQSSPTLFFDLQDQFYELLASNGNCELPCFLGMIPGQTSWQTASQILEKFSLGDKPIAPYGPNGGFDMRGVYIGTSEHLYLSVSLEIATDNNDIVQYMVSRFDTISPAGFSIPDEPRLSQYALLNVIKRLGPPDTVYIDLPVGPQFQSAVLNLVYVRSKVLLEYGSTLETDERGNRIICADGRRFAGQIAVANPSSSLDVKTLFASPFYESSSNIDVVQLIGSKVQYFYSVILHNDPECFDL